MPPEDASTQAESTTTDVAAIDPSTLSPEAASGFKADSALAPKQRSEIFDAWSKVADQHDPEADPAKLDAAPAQAAPAKAKAKPEPEAEVEAEEEASAEEEEQEAAKPARKLTQAENRELMKARIAQNQRFQRREQAQEQRFAQREAQVAQKEAEFRAQYEPLAKAKSAIESGDFDGFATALGYTDWNTMQGEALQAVQSPVYKRMRALEKEREAERAQLAQQREEYQKQQAQQAQAQEIQNWKANLRDECLSDEDPAVAELVEARPQIVDALFAIQQQHYHQSGGDLLPARDTVLQFCENVRTDFEFWAPLIEANPELFGSQAASAKAKPAAQPVRAAVLERQTNKKTSGAAQAPAGVKPVAAVAKPRAPSKTISQAQTAGASALKGMNDKELKAHYERLMQQEWSQPAA